MLEIPACRLVRQQGAGHELERDGAAELGIAGTIHLAQRTFTHALDQVVMRDGGERRESGFGIRSSGFGNAQPSAFFFRSSSRQLFFGGFEGRISTRLGRLRAGGARRSITTSATSSGASFQSDPPAPVLRPNSVATEPGWTQLTLMSSYRSSSISASLNAFSEALMLELRY